MASTDAHSPQANERLWHAQAEAYRLATSVSIPLFEAELAAFARTVGAGPTVEIVLVLDRAGWHTSVRLRVQ